MIFVTLVLGDLVSFSDLLWAPGTHGIHKYVCRQNTRTQDNKINL